VLNPSGLARQASSAASSGSGSAARAGNESSKNNSSKAGMTMELVPSLLNIICRNVILARNLTNDEIVSLQGKARVNQQGRIVIPPECCSASGIKPGDEVPIELVGEGELRLRTRR
jgi:AbrB family looped-hinge helix DNA binding protein